MAIKNTIFILIILFINSSLWASTSSKRYTKVSSVKVTGNKRIQKEAILNKISFFVKRDKTFSGTKVTEDVRTLFQTGFFEDIEVIKSSGRKGITLTYKVVERPSISSITYTGNKKVTTEDIEEKIQFNTFELFDYSKVKQSLKTIKEMYEEKGFYLADISFKKSEITPHGTVDLKILINENQKVRIHRIDIVGNKKLSDEKIKKFMMTKVGSLWGMGGTYKSENLSQDLQRIQFLYLTEGYAQAKIQKPILTMSPDKTNFYLQIPIEEGPRFKIGSVNFTGDTLFTESKFLDEIKIDDEEYYSQNIIIADLNKLKVLYGDEGYAFANVSPLTQPQSNSGEEDPLMNLNFRITRGEKVTIGKINIVGNANTRDKVVRREMRISEGELYNETKKNDSLNNIKRTGFFKDATLTLKPRENRPDIADVEVRIEETSTGQVSVGAGFGSAGWGFQGSLQQSNFLGRGQYFAASVNYSEQNQKNFRLSITEPYFLDSKWFTSFNAFNGTTYLIDFSEEKLGTSITVGRNITDYISTSLTYNLDKRWMDLGSNPDRDLYPVHDEDYAEGTNSSLVYSLTYDGRNNRRFPTKGIYAKSSFEYSGLGGSIGFTKTNLDLRFYQPVIGSIVWRNRLVYGVLGDNFSGQTAPFNELFRLGGPYNVRGFDYNSIAKRVYSPFAFNQLVAGGVANAADLANRPYGGLQQLFYNFEFEWDIIAEAKLKGVTFYDIGYADDSFNLGDFKQSVGAGVRWLSPLGLIRVEYGFPLDPNKKLGEESSRFDLSISTTSTF